MMPPAAEGASRLIWFLVDGFPYWLVERFCDRADLLPTLAAAYGDGRLRRLAPAFPNCQTPPSLTSLWTGLEPSVSGIDGFDLPDLSGPDPLAIRRAFDEPITDLPWLWNRYADRGEPVRLCHIPFVAPSRLGGAMRLRSYGFAGRAAPPRVIDAAEAPPSWAAACGPYGTCVRLPRADSSPLVLSRHRIEGRDAIVVMEEAATLVGGPEAADALRTVGWHPLLTQGLSGPYRQGRLGPVLGQGGAGGAETVLAAAVDTLARRFDAELLDAVARADSGLVMAYQPALDLFLHDVAGYCTPDWNGDGIVTALILRVLSSLDQTMERLAALMRPGDRILVSSDHGMMPLDTLVYPNAMLRELGFLALDAGGRIDLAETSAFYHPCESGLFCFVPETLRRAGRTEADVAEALGRAWQQATGKPYELLEVVSAAQSPAFLTARHVLRPAFGQQAKAAPSPLRVERSRKTGEHGTHIPDPHLDGILLDLSGTALAGAPAVLKPHEVLRYLMVPSA